MNKLNFFKLMVMVGIALLCVVAYAQNKPENKSGQGKNLTLLFIQDVSKGSLKAESSNQYKLTVKLQKPQVLSFTNNNKLNMAGEIKPQAFVKSFTEAAKNRSLNSALTIIRVQRNNVAQTEHFILMLSNARITHDGYISYDAKILYQDKPQRGVKVINFNKAILFIDDICIECMFN